LSGKYRIAWGKAALLNFHDEGSHVFGYALLTNCVFLSDLLDDLGLSVPYTEQFPYLSTHRVQLKQAIMLNIKNNAAVCGCH
jgi:hypothetical protein